MPFCRDQHLRCVLCLGFERQSDAVSLESPTSTLGTQQQKRARALCLSCSHAHDSCLLKASVYSSHNTRMRSDSGHADIEC